MNSYQIEFKLFLRKHSPKLKKASTYIFKKLFSLEFVLAVLGIYYAYHSNQLTAQGNTLSKAAYNLSKNDTSQQAQISKLTQILAQTRKQNDYAQSQIDTLAKILNEIKDQNIQTQEQTKHLITIAVASKEEDSLTNKLLEGFQKQLELNNQQLGLSKKSDSTTSVQLILQRQSDILSLLARFDQLDSIGYQNEIKHMDSLSYDQILEMISKMKSILERGFSNKVVLTDPVVGKLWSKYYLILRQEGQRLRQTVLQTKPPPAFPFYKSTGVTFYQYYNEFVDPLRQRLKRLQLQINENLGLYLNEDGDLNFNQPD